VCASRAGFWGVWCVVLRLVLGPRFVRAVQCAQCEDVYALCPFPGYWKSVCGCGRKKKAAANRVSLRSDAGPDYGSSSSNPLIEPLDSRMQGLVRATLCFVPVFGQLCLPHALAAPPFLLRAFG
jgi:hypothetical protein